MKDQFNKFEAERNKLDERIVQLREELDSLTIEKSRLERERASALRDFMNPVDVSQFDIGIETAHRQIRSLEQSIRYAQEGKLEQLAKLIPDVTKYEKQSEAEKVAEYESAILKLNRFKIEYLAHMKSIGELAREVDEIHATANRYRQEAGLNPVKHWKFTDRMTINADPSRSGFDHASAVCLGIERWLVESALNGRLPNWADDVIKKGGK